ncbi:UNVERIFIED_CONTAM: hypothetical protein GTU68_023902 [Idotea baltica]|nr:hypothetical protein [Idotea baltica]
MDRYRFKKETVQRLYDLISNDIYNPTKRSFAIDGFLQLCVALRYFATGAFYINNGDIHGISKSSVSRCIHNISRAICNCRELAIQFPTSPETQRSIKEGFATMGFPNTLGAIDGTHIVILAPNGERERQYVNRKNHHSINVQIICDSKYKILNLVCKWPGSTHDSFIWEHCKIHDHFKNGLLDNGWLIAQRRYNRTFKHTRSTVERSIGLLKSRFRVLDQTAGKMMLQPEKCTYVITAIGMLHNLAIKERLPIDQFNLNRIIQNERDYGVPNIPLPFQTGRVIQNTVIEQHFAY